MALNANALCLLDEAKTHIDIPLANTDRDTEIERLINVASAFIEGHTKRKLTTTTYTEYQDGRASNRLLLKQWPITGGPALANTHPQIFIDNSSIFDSESEVDATTYFVENEIEIIRNGCGYTWPKGYRNIKIVYEAGLGVVVPTVSNSLPADLTHACLEYLLWLDEMHTDRRIGRNSKNKSGESVSFETLIPPHITNMLEPYVREEFPSDAPVGVRNR